MTVIQRLKFQALKIILFDYHIGYDAGSRGRADVKGLQAMTVPVYIAALSLAKREE
jgi:hypothetical protein